VLGSVGLGVLVLRNVTDRRSELALLRALGFRKLSLFQLLLAEHVGILALGLFCGAAAAMFAAYPALGSVRPDSLIVASLFLSGSLWNGLIWTTLATAFALRGPLLDGLRGE
jgi:ABC-type antimicrobial peptide transport system permease subunit